MKFKTFKNVRIYRPDIDSEVYLKEKSKRNLLSSYGEGEYKESKVIGEILNHQFSFYERVLDENIHSISSSHLIDFLLYQYDQYAEVEALYKSHRLSHAQEDDWIHIGPMARRAIKYFVERVVLLKPDEEPATSREMINKKLSLCWIAAEELTRLYLMSDQTYAVFPNESLLKICDEDIYFNLDLEDRKKYYIDVRSDTQNRSKYASDNEISILNDINLQNKIIGSALEKTIGVDYAVAISILTMIIKNSESAADQFPVKFVNLDDCIDILSETTGHSKNSILSVINGFSISAENMSAECRQIFKPKQEYRALKRGFFIVDHLGGKHLSFSDNMAQEALVTLVHNVVFKKLPSEWLSKETTRTLDKLSNEAGKWFERIVSRNIESISIKHLSSIKKLTLSNGVKKFTPPDVGEIDIIGYSLETKNIYIFECKLVKHATEGAFFRDDLSSFVNSKKSYKLKFDRKIDWLKNNLNVVIDFLAKNKIYVEGFNEIKPAFITYYPTIAMHFIDDYPCVSVTQFMESWKNYDEYNLKN